MTPKNNLAPVHERTLSFRHSRARLHVYVWPNRETMWRAAKAEGYETRTARAVVIHKKTGKRVHNRATVHFSRRCIGTEVVCHESVHAANWLLASSPGARRFKDADETLAFWTGQIASAIVSEFYRDGLYE